MHFLLVAYHFPPDRAVGALRPARMADALAAAGHRVTIITAKLPGEVQPIRPSPPGTAVFAVSPLPNPREFYLRGKRLLARFRLAPRAPVPPPSPGEAEPAPPRATGPLWKRSILAMLWLPDDHQGFVPAAIAQARRVHAREPVDYLITTAPPFSTHLAGLRIQRHTGARWAADFRDPWTGNPWKPPAVRTAVTDRVERWLERRVLDRADLIVSASDGIRRSLERHPGVATGKHLLIRNGIETLRERLPRGPDLPFRILHMGTFYHGRDPRPFLEALAETVRRHPDVRLRADFVGKSRAFRGRSIPDMVRELGLDQVVAFHDFMPRAEVGRMAAESDLLLLLAQNQPDQVPQKLYEYLGTRVPIIAFVDRGGETARMLERVGGHHTVFDNDVDAAVRALESALGTSENEPAGDPAVLEGWTADTQLKRFIDALGV